MASDSIDPLREDPRLRWIMYDEFQMNRRLGAGSLSDDPPPEFLLPPPPPPPDTFLECSDSVEDFQTCDSILTSSTLSDEDHPFFSAHLQSLSIILAVSCIFILAVCITIFIIWRRRRSRTRLDYLWKDTSSHPHRPDHSHHPLIFDDGFENRGSSSGYRLNRALPRNEFSNETLHSNIFRIPDSESQIYEEVMDRSTGSVSQDFNFHRNPPPPPTSNGRNPSYFSGTTTRLKDYSTSEESTNHLPLLSPTYSTPPRSLHPSHHSSSRKRAPDSRNKGRNIFFTWLNRNSSSSSSSSPTATEYRFLTTSKQRRGLDSGSGGGVPTLRLSDYPSALQQPLIYYSARTPGNPPPLQPPPHHHHHIYTTPLNGNAFYGDLSGLMPNPDDILPKEAWTDFPEEGNPDKRIKKDPKTPKKPSKVPNVRGKPSNSCDTNSLNSLKNHNSMSSDTTCPDEESDERFNSSSNSSQGSVLR